MCVLLLQGRYLLNCGACQWEFSALSTKLKVVSPFDHFLLSVGELPINCSKRESLTGIKWMLCCAIAMDVAKEKLRRLFYQSSWLFYSTVPSKFPHVFVFSEQFELVVSCFSVGKIRWQPALTDTPIQQSLAAHSTWHFALSWQGCRVLFIPNAYSCCLKRPLVGISARLCSKKNWRKPSALNLWNSGCPAYDFYHYTTTWEISANWLA